MSTIAHDDGLNRRRLLALGGATAAALAAAPAALAALAAAAPADAGDEPAGTPDGPVHLRRSAWSGLVGTTFAVRDGAAALRLEGVADVGPAALAGADHAFSLRFSGPAGAVDAAEPQVLAHPSLGPVLLSLQPVGPPAERTTHEAVVWRLPPPKDG